MNIIFMGTPDFAVGTLEALAEAGHQITLAVTQPDKPKGRGHSVQYTPVKEAAARLGIPVYQPQKIRSEESVRYLESIGADVIVVVAFGQMLPKSILEMKKYGCINVHASLLPKYRGAAPIQWAVINGEKESGVTIMQMDEGLDTGDMLAKVVVPLDEKETGGSLFDKLSAAGARLCAGLNPWPSAYTKLNGKSLKIWECQVVPADVSKGVCGEILEVTKDSMIVQTGEGALAVKTLQLEGKKRMDAGAFLRGFSVDKGTILGAE